MKRILMLSLLTFLLMSACSSSSGEKDNSIRDAILGSNGSGGGDESPEEDELVPFSNGPTSDPADLDLSEE